MKKSTVVLLILLLLGAGYFLLFWLPNSTGARDFNMTFIFEQDEPAQYPHVVRRLEPGKTIPQTIYRFLPTSITILASRIIFTRRWFYCL